jgi:alpha,alpha-trehalase
MQFIAMSAMNNYGFKEDARRIATRWLNTVTRNYLDPQPASYPPFKYGDGTRHPGFIYEKYTRDGQINDAEYSCSEMMGWTAATFLRALQITQ